MQFKLSFIISLERLNRYKIAHEEYMSKLHNSLFLKAAEILYSTVSVVGAETNFGSGSTKHVTVVGVCPHDPFPLSNDSLEVLLRNSYGLGGRL